MAFINIAHPAFHVLQDPNILLQIFLHTGTFLGNNEGERKAMKAPDRTASLWSYINRHEVLPKYLNPMYEPNQRVIWPSVAPMSLVRNNGKH